MEIDIKGIQCAGVSFTDGFDNKYMKYYESVNDTKKGRVSYAELQRIFEENFKITNSATRVDFPFLFNNGLINEYRSGYIEEIELEKLFTNLGKSYYEVLKLKELLDIEDSFIMNEIYNIKSLIICETLFYRKKTNNKEYYFDMLKYISDYGKINEKEFFLMIKYSDSADLLDKYRNDYRNGDIEIELKNANNAYQYTKKILLQSNLIIENKEENILILNTSKESIIKKLLKGE